MQYIPETATKQVRRKRCSWRFALRVDAQRQATRRRHRNGRSRLVLGLGAIRVTLRATRRATLRAHVQPDVQPYVRP